MRAVVSIVCEFCGITFERRWAEITYRSKHGLVSRYCSRQCAGEARKIDKTNEQKKADKSAYDKVYRLKNLERIKAQKAAYYRANIDRDKERDDRKRRMPSHVEYCRRPEYKAWKHEYDIARASMSYDEFAESWRILLEIEKEVIRQVPCKYQRSIMRGLIQKQKEKQRHKRLLK